MTEIVGGVVKELTVPSDFITAGLFLQVTDAIMPNNSFAFY